VSGHGYGAYSHGCRCAVCRNAKADYMRGRRRSARKHAQLHTTNPSGRQASWATAFMPGATRFVAPIDRHGTRCGYEEWGCRCLDCTTARTVSDAKYRHKRTRPELSTGLCTEIGV